VVEDNAVNRRLLTELLRHRGHRVTGAMDGAVAVELAQARRFDAILMDVAMPRMDGLEATRRIREDSLCRDVPVIGVTANADPERIPEFHAAGMSLVLTKPIDIAAIDRAVRAGSGGAAGAGGPCARGPSAAGGVDAQGPGAEGVAADGAETGGAGRSAAPGGARAACGLDHARLTQLEEDLGRAALAGFLAAHDREVTAALDCHAGEAWGEAPAPPLPPGGDEPLHAASSAPRHRNGRGGGGAGSALAAEPGLAGAAADEGAGAGALAGKGAGAGSGASLGAASGASLGAASGPSLGAGPLPPPAADARGERLRAEAHRLSGAAATLGLQGLAALWAEVEARAAAGQPTTDMLRHLVLARAAAREGLAARGLAPAPQDTDAPSVRGPD
jgi:CheY-like chemotaxis protein